MSFCKTCLCFWKYHRAKVDPYSGTCWRDGSKTKSDWSCGFHSDKQKPEPKHIAPDKRDRKEIG